LSDEEVPEPRPEPPTIPEPELPGAGQDELDEVKNDLLQLTDLVGTLSKSFEEYKFNTDNNFSKIEQNMRMLAA